MVKLGWSSVDETYSWNYAYGTKNNWICKKEEIKCDNIIKQYKNWLALILLRKKA